MQTKPLRIEGGRSLTCSSGEKQLRFLLPKLTLERIQKWKVVTNEVHIL